MKHSEKRTMVERLCHVMIAGFFAITVLGAFASIPSYAVEPQTSGNEELRKMIKQAVKLTRAGLFDQSETILRRAVELDPKSTSAKLELAFVLTKQRKLVEAYNLAFPIAEAGEPLFTQYRV